MSNTLNKIFFSHFMYFPDKNSDFTFTYLAATFTVIYDKHVSKLKLWGSVTEDQALINPRFPIKNVCKNMDTIVVAIFILLLYIRRKL